MTQSLQTIRNNILTSIYGRRLGLNPSEFLVGPKDLVKVTQFIGSSTNSSASSTGTALNNYGITALAVATQAASTGSSYGSTEVGGQFLLAPPAEGVEKLIYTASQHSTMLITVNFSTGYTVTGQQSSAGSSFGGLSFNAPGQWARLIGVSTAKWQVMGIATGASLAAT